MNQHNPQESPDVEGAIRLLQSPDIQLRQSGTRGRLNL
jgi:hypothetical protein